MSSCDLLVVGAGPAGEDRAPYERPPLSKELLRGALAQGEVAGWSAAGRDASWDGQRLIAQGASAP